MSWHYSQAQVEESSVDICLDGEQSAQSNKNPMPSAFCSKDKMTRFSRLSRFGMTFAPLTESRGKELLTWFLEGFHARTSVQPEKEQESKEKEVDSGVRWQESLGKLNRNGSLQKTHQCLFPEDSISSSPILPKWGLMLDGELLEQTMSEQITKGTEFGLSQETWPTPDANMGARGTQEHWTKTRPSGQPAQYTLNQAVRDSVKMWPTPRASSAMNDKQETCLKRIKKRGYEGKLEQAVTMWPTPTTDIGHERSREYWVKRVGKHQIDLQGAVKMWPTPTANEDACGKPSGKMQKMLDNHPEVRNQGTGTLNPMWVEWLMGWPLGHTDLKRLEMDKYQKWLELHGRH